jgi:hypothetical protein
VSFVQARQAPPAQNGVAAGQSVFETQLTQAPLPPQKGRAPPDRVLHSAFDAQARQAPVPVSQKGVAPEQLPLPVQVTHWPASAPLVAQMGLPKVDVHSAADAQARQVPALVLQKGVAPEQLAFEVQLTHRFVDVLHVAFAPPQSELTVHCTQRPPVHTGRVASRAAHSAPVAQPRHWLLVALQMGAEAGHCDEASHCTQAPALGPAVAHWGVELPHSLSPAQARQLPAPVSQMGFVPAQCAFCRHCWHLLVAVLQWPPDGQLPSPVQATQAPLAAQARVPAPSAAHSAPLMHARQVLLAESQKGVVGLEQSAFARHLTHTFVLVLHSGVPGPQLAFDVHCTHAPVEAQAAVGAWQSPAAQARQTPPAPVSQMGVAGVVRQSLPDAHCTQAPASAPPAGAHRGLPKAAMHSALPAQARHAPPSQNGAEAGQSALAVHCTQPPPVQMAWLASRAAHSAFEPQVRQRPVAVLQNGVEPEQLWSAAHWTQAPAFGPLVAHTGSASWVMQSAAEAQARQVMLAVLQIGVVPEQFALDAHDLHWCVPVSHCPPAQSAPCVHCTQPPPA